MYYVSGPIYKFLSFILKSVLSGMGLLLYNPSVIFIKLAIRRAKMGYIYFYRKERRVKD